MNLPQYGDLGGYQKPWFLRSGAEKNVRKEDFSLTKDYLPLV